jgi:hypothetical protein
MVAIVVPFAALACSGGNAAQPLVDAPVSATATATDTKDTAAAGATQPAASETSCTTGCDADAAGATATATATASASASAAASPSDAGVSSMAKARDLFRDGVQLFASGDYAGALSKFQAAYAVVPHPAVLYNIATCEERLGRDQDALAAYQQYLAAMPSGTAHRAEAQQHIAALKAKLGIP